ARSPASPYSVPFRSTQPPPAQLYTLSLHDALPISAPVAALGALREHLEVVHQRAHPRLHLLLLGARQEADVLAQRDGHARHDDLDRKSTRLNSSHVKISYAVFCLKKKKYKIQ